MYTKEQKKEARKRLIILTSISNWEESEELCRERDSLLNILDPEYVPESEKHLPFRQRIGKYLDRNPQIEEEILQSIKSGMNQMDVMVAHRCTRELVSVVRNRHIEEIQIALIKTKTPKITRKKRNKAKHEIKQEEFTRIFEVGGNKALIEYYGISNSWIEKLKRRFGLTKQYKK